MSLNILLLSSLFTEEGRGFLPNIKPEYFSTKESIYIYNTILSIYNTHTTYTLEDIKEHILSTNTKEIDKELYLDILRRVEDTLDMTTPVHTLEIIKKALHHKIYREILEEIVEAINTTSYIDYSKFLSSLQRLEDIKPSVEDGELIEFGKETEEDLEPPQLISTGLKTLDDILDGGHAVGEYGLLVADTGYGKSAFLTILAAHAALRGERVCVFLHELGKREMLKRLHAHFGASGTRNPKLDGSLLLYDISDRITTPATLRQIIGKLNRGSQPLTLICNDYLDEMTINGKGGGDAYTDQGKILEENRRTAKRYNLAWWDATQSTRGAGELMWITKNETADSYNKARKTDVWISLNQTPGEKKVNQMRLLLDKFRRGEYPKKIQIGIDFQTMRAWDMEQRRKL